MPVLADFVLDTFPGGGVVSVVRDSVGLGLVIADVCSWQRNRSIVRAILAGLLSWCYVGYFARVSPSRFPPGMQEAEKSK